MELDKLISMEMQNISQQDAELLADMECTVGQCGGTASGGTVTCGDKNEVN